MIRKEKEEMGWLKKVLQALREALPDIRIQTPPSGKVRGSGTSNRSVWPVNTGGKKPGSWSPGRHR